MDDLFPSAAIGAVAGLRAFTSPAAVSTAGFLGSKTASRVLIGLALAELVADKLPATPSRLAPPALGARLVSGALCGAVLGSHRRKSAIQGAVLGAIGAAAAAYAAYHLRQALVNRYDLPDTAVALAEDAVALGAATAIVSAGSRP